MAMNRDRRLREIDLDAEYQRHVEHIKSLVGKPVPLSRAYTHGEHPTLISIDGDTATIRFRNGAVLSQVPLRDLVDNAGYWKS